MAKEEKYYEKLADENTDRLRELLQELPAFCTEYFRSLKNGTEPRTRLEYAKDLKTFFTYLHDSGTGEWGEMPIHDYTVGMLNRVTKEDLESYMDYITKYEYDGKVRKNAERGSGKKRKLAALHGLFGYYFREEKLDRDVSILVTPVSIRKKDNKSIIRLDAAETANFLDEVDSAEGLTKRQQAFNKRTQVRDAAICTVFLGTGLRVSELVGLDLSDINFDDGCLMIHRKGGYDSAVYFGEEVAAALEAYLAEREEITPAPGNENALFLSLQKKRISTRAVEKMVSKYAANVTGKHITPHKLRATYGSSLYQATGDIYLVADTLGHTSVETTKTYYAQMPEENRRRTANA
ncbi:MAG: tyrosine-type recombinase/integrase, partial [Lachnospiraceae bacterium]